MKRDFNIDFMRFFACIMVLFTHSPQVYQGQPGRVFIGIDNYFGMAWGPILFFMISGACVLGKEMPAKDFIKKRLSRVLVPTIIWSLIYIVVETFLWQSAPIKDWYLNITRVFFLPQTGHLWFMYAIISIYLVAPIISSWLNHSSKHDIRLYLCIWGFTLLLPYIGIIAPSSKNLLGYNGILFYFNGFLWCAVAGYYFKKYCHIDSVKWWHFVICMIVVISPAYVFLLKRLTGQMFDMSSCLFPMLTTIMSFIILCNIRWKASFCDSICAKAITLISKLSFGIYLSHMLFMEPLRHWIAQFNMNYVIQMPVSVFIVLILSVLVTWIISKMPFSKYLIG